MTTKKKAAKKTAKTTTTKKARAPRSPARDEILVSLQESTEHLEELGSRIAATRLVEIARDHVRFAEEDEAVLGSCGFGADWRRALTTEIDALDARKNEREKIGAACGPSGSDLSAEMENARQWVKEDDAAVKNSGPAVRDNAPHPNHGHAQSPVLLAGDLKTLAGYIETNAKATASHGGGAAFAARGLELAAKLSAARATHSKARGKVPVAVRSLHQIDGLVYAELVRLSTSAHAKLSPVQAKRYGLGDVHGHHRERPKAADSPSSPPGVAPKAK